MSLIKAIKAQLGLSVTPANNFSLDASADNGTMKLARNNGQDILTVDAAGKVAFPRGVKLPSSPSASSDPNTLDVYQEELSDYFAGMVPSSGAFSNATNVANFIRIGSIVLFTIDIAIVDAGTGNFIIVTLPLPAFGPAVGYGRDTSNGKMIQGTCTPGSNQLHLFNYDNTDPVHSGARIQLTACYLVGATA